MKIIQLMAPSRPFAAIFKDEEGPGFHEMDVVAWALYDDGSTAALIMEDNEANLFSVKELSGFERIVDSADIGEKNGRPRDHR